MYFILTYFPLLDGGGYFAIIGNRTSFNSLVFIFFDLLLYTVTADSIALNILCLLIIEVKIIGTSSVLRWCDRFVHVFSFQNPKH